MQCYNNNTQEEEKEREYSPPPQYCEVCRHFKLNHYKYYCYTDKGKNRQIITICIECLRRYQEKRYQLFGKPTGVIAISVKSRVQCLIMSALRLAFMKRREKIKRSNSSNNSINMPAATATDDDIQLDHGNDNDNIF